MPIESVVYLFYVVFFLIQGVERVEEAVDRQPGDPAVLPLHEGGQGRTGRRGVRQDVPRVCGVAGGSGAGSHVDHIQQHRQAGSRQETRLNDI